MNMQQERKGVTVERLRNRYEFRRVYEKGISCASQYLVLFVLENDKNVIRVGYSVGKRLGKAVTRNRVRRLLRESFRSVAGKLSSSSVDIIWIARSTAISARQADIEHEMKLLLARSGLLN